MYNTNNVIRMFLSGVFLVNPSILSNQFNGIEYLINLPSYITFEFDCYIITDIEMQIYLFMLLWNYQYQWRYQ